LSDSFLKYKNYVESVYKIFIKTQTHKKTKAMNIFKKIRKKRLQAKMNKLQSQMEQINNLYKTEKDEISMVDCLILNPNGKVLDLINGGHSIETLNRFRRVAYINFSADISNGDKFGYYQVTPFGMRMLSFESDLSILSA
jgi:hypothetical protein